MVIPNEEVQIARATKLSYEQFLIALYLFDNYKDESMNNKKAIVEMIRDEQENEPSEPVSIEIIKSENFPMPSDKVWLECVEAAQDHIGNRVKADKELVLK